MIRHQGALFLCEGEHIQAACLCGEYRLYSPHEVRRIKKYIHELPDGPGFRWSNDALLHRLVAVRHRQGRLMPDLSLFALISVK